MQGESTKSITTLFGNLAEYESTMRIQKEFYGDKKKKSLALAATKMDESSDDEDLDEDDIALMARRLRRIYRNRGRSQRGSSSFKK